MKFHLIFIALIVLSCQNKTVDAKSASHSTIDTVSLITEQDTISAHVETPSGGSKIGLILTSNALQTIDKETGSTREIAFGMPIDQVVKMVNNILNQQGVIGVNSECGAGPLKMATWENGLTLVFENKGAEWMFAGWFVTKPRFKSTHVLTTMAGVGVGTSRSEFEKAYVIKVGKTSLGYEFSTSAGLFGIFDGGGNDAVITDMWSGTSCNFR